jgi:hypothetical protein
MFEAGRANPGDGSPSLHYGSFKEGADGRTGKADWRRVVEGLGSARYPPFAIFFFRSGGFGRGRGS